jgi:hypothetical protein
MSTIVSPKTGRLIKVGGKTYNDLLKDPKFHSLSPSAVKPQESGKVAPIVTLPPLSQFSSNKKELNLPPLPLSPVFSSNDSSQTYSQGYSPTSPDSSLSNVPILTNVSPIALPPTPTHSLPPLNLPLKGNLPSSLPLSRLPSLEETLEHARQPKQKENVERMIKEGREKEGRGIRTRGWRASMPSKGRERHELKEKCGDKCFLLPGEEKFPICPSPRLTQGQSPCQIDCRGLVAAKARAREYKYEDVASKAEELLKECEAAGVGVERKGRKSSSSKLPKIPTSPKLSPSMIAAGRYEKDLDFEGERRREDYGLVRRNVRRSAIVGNSTNHKNYDHTAKRDSMDYSRERRDSHEQQNHKQNEGDWERHHHYMSKNYHWDEDRWIHYRNHLQNMDFSHKNTQKDHKKYMMKNYNFNEQDWKNYKQHMKNLSDDLDRSHSYKEKHEERNLLSPSMKEFGKHYDLNTENKDNIDIFPSMTEYGKHEDCGCGNSE